LLIDKTQDLEVVWVKIYGSRAKGNYRRGSDIDLAFSSSVNYSAKLLGIYSM